MGGALGGMMMRVANSMGMGCTHAHYAPARPKRKSWAQRIEQETKDDLWNLQQDRENKRAKAINVFKHRLLDNYDQFAEAGLVAPGDSLMQIICRAHGLQMPKKRKRKS